MSGVRSLRFLCILLAVVSIGVIAGCAEQPQVAHGPAKPALVQFQRLSILGTDGTRVVCPHYVINSTLSDPQALHNVAEVLEGALAEYRALAPEVRLSERPMECYLFDTRAQWAAFTSEHTGDDSKIYLRVNRGGYTVGDWFVAYWIGDPATYSVAAHEGWHQYVARNLKGRLPPFLEEGLACLFEQVQWEGDLPRWDLSANGSRLQSLRSAETAQQLIPLERLVRMHAGQVVGRPASQIEAFYAESWAFARFLYNGNEGRNRQALGRMLTDAARGELFNDNSRQLADGPLWDPATAKPMLEHYLGKSLSQTEREFRTYMEQLTSQSSPPPAG